MRTYLLRTSQSLTLRGLRTLGAVGGTAEHSIRRLGVDHSLRAGGARQTTRAMRFRKALGRKKAVIKLHGKNRGLAFSLQG